LFYHGKGTKKVPIGSRLRKIASKITRKNLSAVRKQRSISEKKLVSRIKKVEVMDYKTKLSSKKPSRKSVTDAKKVLASKEAQLKKLGFLQLTKKKQLRKEIEDLKKKIEEKYIPKKIESQHKILTQPEKNIPEKKISKEQKRKKTQSVSNEDFFDAPEEESTA
jgi:hypothetical protein